MLDAGEHVLLVGAAAWRFAAEVGIAPAPAGSLITERACARLQAKGTVGACARDVRGDFAAATSTGGIVGKRSGRVGDTPIPGAGTWADRTCAVSATGDGEAILRVALARGIASRLAAGRMLDDAVGDALAELRDVTAASAGAIAVTSAGVIGAQLSPAMPIAWVTRDGDDAIALDSLGRVM